MLSLQFIRDNPDAVRKALHDRQSEEAGLDEILRLDRERRDLLAQTEVLRAERNAIGKRVGSAGDAAERQRLIDETRHLSDGLDALEPRGKEIDERLNARRTPSIRCSLCMEYLGPAKWTMRVCPCDIRYSTALFEASTFSTSTRLAFTPRISSSSTNGTLRRFSSNRCDRSVSSSSTGVTTTPSAPCSHRISIAVRSASGSPSELATSTL